MITKTNKRLVGFSSCLLLLASSLFIGCSQDDGNYDYLPDDEVGQIKVEVDTTLTKNQYVIYTLNPGDTIDFHLKVDYAHAERLEYRWFYLKTYYNQYRAEQIGNAMVYPPADTIYNKKDLYWICDLNPGTYIFYCQITDPVTGMKAYWKASQYSVVNSSGTKGGLYLLTERITAPPRSTIWRENHCSSEGRIQEKHRKMPTL